MDTLDESSNGLFVQHLKGCTFSIAENHSSRDLGTKLILPDVILNLQNEVKSDVSEDRGSDITLPLPEPKWGSEPDHLEFSSLVTFEFFLEELRDILASELESHPYNTVGSFLAFYDAFLKQGLSLTEFYHNYDPKILPESLSCVGLGCSLMENMKSVLSNCYPGLKSALFLASCEEMVLEIDTYISCSPPSQILSVKEHVLVVLKVLVEGREGYIVLDPGYHVNIPVIVMSDGLFPNTGWFLLSDTEKSKKEYNYTVDGSYIQWHVKETRNGKVNSWTNLVYVGRRFLSYVDVSEKRNLVFNFRTIVKRDRKQPVAGLYCNLEGDERFTFFYYDESYKRVEVKIPFSYFQGKRENNKFESAISSCVAQIGFNETYVSQMVEGIVDAYFNPNFMPFVRMLNAEIDEE
ncbi:hypothetical protein AVEN_22323-1 [Araneus ventricosus]|uniref:Uncharacterized protein n=1 Tax=Araneus ventricosus TaxID=182803 RepID=A0A4Y2MPE7_ARAVE|nr:hypothetical protein AVEN_45355-1 [Araneus ventricosus]GBN28439.1 hypothetical protein AVEN_22323-1 [Araneus ventricosus]